MPDDLAGIRVDGHGGGREQVVAGAQVAVPRGRVAGAGKDQVGFRIVGGAVPGGCAAGLPQVAGPGGVGGAGDAVFDLLAVHPLVAHVAFDGRAHPHHLAGLGIAGFHAALHAELATGHAGDDQALDDQRSGRSGVAGGVVVDLFLPHDLAGVLVQGHELGVEGREDNQIAVQCRAAVNHVTARHDAFGQAVLVLPELLAGLGVERKDAAVGGGHVHLAVENDGLGFLAALLLATEGEGPHRDQVLDGLDVDLVECAEALTLLAEAEMDHIAGGLGVIGNVGVGYFFRLDRARDHQRSGNHGHRERLFHFFAPLDH